MTAARKAPKPVRAWALVDRMTQTPHIMWFCLVSRRRDMEFQYLYWLCGQDDLNREARRQEYRDRIASGTYTIERVTVSV